VKHRIEQLNQSYKKALGAVLQEEFAGEGIIVEDVLLDPSLQHGRVWLICTKEQLKGVIERKSTLQSMTQNYVKTRYTPKLEFLLTDNYLEKMENLFGKVEGEQ
jgi:ribosome-binding factor A